MNTIRYNVIYYIITYNRSSLPGDYKFPLLLTRKERESREAVERNRAQELMKRLNPTIREEEKKEDPKSEPPQYYNSAFNPEFSKHFNRNKKRRY